MLQVKLNMAQWRDVKITGNTVARFLGFICLKPEQRLTIKKSVKPCDVLPSCVTKRTHKVTVRHLPSIVHDEVFKVKHSIIIVTTIMNSITYKHHHFILKMSHAKLCYFNE